VRPILNVFAVVCKSGMTWAELERRVSRRLAVVVRTEVLGGPMKVVFHGLDAEGRPAHCSVKMVDLPGAVEAALGHPPRSPRA